jgi:hypothetical protein
MPWSIDVVLANRQPFKTAFSEWAAGVSRRGGNDATRSRARRTTQEARTRRNSDASKGLGRVARPAVSEMMTDQKPTTGDKQALDNLADEALAAAQSMPSGPREN